MSHAKAVVATAILLGAAIAACSAVEDATTSPLGGPPDKAGADAGDNSSFNSGEGGAGTAQSPGALNPTDNAIIIVHAAGTNAFRLCFDSTPDAQPTPTQDLMPQANVVGVERGSAVRIDPMATPGDVYFIPEALVRGNPSITCSDAEGSGSGEGFATKIGTIPDDLSTGVHLLVVTGCQSQPVNQALYDTARCGADYKGTSNLAIKEFTLTGKRRDGDILPFDIVNLSQGLDSLRTTSNKDLTITFGELTSTSAETTSINPPFETVSEFGSPTLDADAGIAVYGSLGFKVQLGDTELAQQSLADIQALSAPHDVPPTYYATASNYVLLLLGAPSTELDAGDTDGRDLLHFLAVPVVNPKPDAGADGGADDGGDAAVQP